MNADQIYSLVNTLVLLPWLLMLVAPKWKWTQNIIFSFAFPLLFAGVYLFLLVLYFNEGSGDFSTLEGLTALFSNKKLVLVGWLHYLAFDLFVGSWELSDAQKNGIKHLLLVPCLLLTFVMGPVGLLLYLSIRWAKTKKLVVDS